MELVEGPSLLGVLEAPGSHARPDPAVVALGLASALEYIHSQGVIHRDIKPGNILLAEGRRALLADFGLSRGAESNPLTTEGFVVGTPSYLAPEQLTQGVTNEQTDLFQLGLVLYELVSGKLFIDRAGPDVRWILAERMEGRTPELSAVAPGCPAVLAQAVMRCLEKDPRRRFAKASELAAALVSLAPSSTGELPLECVREEAVVSPGYRGGAGRSREATVVRGNSRSSVPAGRQAQPAGEPTGNRRTLVLAATVVVAIATGLMAMRRAEPRPETRATPPPAPAAAVDLTLQDVDWAYDSGTSRLQVRCKVSHPVLSAYRFGTADILLPRPSAFLEASIPHTPGSTFTLELLRSDAGPAIRLTEHDLTRSLRTSGARLTATLRDFWTRTRHTDQSLVDEVRRVALAERGQRSSALEKLLAQQYRILQPVRSFLMKSALFFDCDAVPAVERKALYKTIAPLQLLDSFAQHFKLPAPFGSEIAKCLSSRFAKSQLPNVDRYDNYVVLAPQGEALLGSVRETSLSSPSRANSVLICTTYRFSTPGVVRLTLNDLPVYFSQVPDRFFTDSYHIRAALAFSGKATSTSWEDFPKKVNSIALGHRIDSTFLNTKPVLRWSIDAVWIVPRSLFEHNVIWHTWISYPRERKLKD
jgi:hypothetical protein